MTNEAVRVKMMPTVKALELAYYLTDYIMLGAPRESLIALINKYISDEAICRDCKGVIRARSKCMLHISFCKFEKKKILNVGEIVNITEGD